jgi:hypothetical protein
VTIDDLNAFVTGLGLKVESLTGVDNQAYTVIRAIKVPTGAKKGMTCDVGLLHSASVPFIPPPAIHVRPALVPMGTQSAQASGIGAEWQYLSRRLDRPVTPKALWTHILTVLGELT